MNTGERAIKKHITAIKTLVEDGRLSPVTGVSVIIAKWMNDHRLSPDIPKRLSDSLIRGELIPLGGVMDCWHNGADGDDWGDKKTLTVDGETAAVLRHFFQEKHLFAGWDSAIIGLLYQKLLPPSQKKQSGVFYTPLELAAQLASMAGPVDGNSKILDPACGGGALLSAMYDRLMTENPHLSHESVLTSVLWGIDTDPAAVIASRAVLALKNARYSFPRNIVQADALFDRRERSWRDFDRIIANPPYIGHKSLKSQYMDALRQTYPGVYGDKGDIAYCFYVNAFNRLKEGGIAAFLVSRYFTEARSGEGLRRFLSGNTHIQTVVDFNGERVIKGVGIDPMIIVFENRSEKGGDINVRKRVVTIRPERSKTKNPDAPSPKKSNDQNLCDNAVNICADELKKFQSFTISQSALGATPWHLIDPVTRAIVDRMQRACGTTLGKEVQFFQGIITGADGVFVIDRGKKEIPEVLSPYLKPWVKNSRVKPCRIDESQQSLIYVRGDEAGMSPGLLAYLSPHRARLEKRRECRAGRMPWYALQWPRKPGLFDREKIIFPYKAEKNRFAVDDLGLYFSADIYGMIPREIDPKGLCVLLNSACYNHYVKSFVKKLGGALYEYYPNTLERLEIPEPDASLYCELAPYYDIIKTSNNTGAAMVAADNIIAAYFGLDAAQKQYIGVRYAKEFF